MSCSTGGGGKGAAAPPPWIRPWLGRESVDKSINPYFQNAALHSFVGLAGDIREGVKKNCGNVKKKGPCPPPEELVWGTGRPGLVCLLYEDPVILGDYCSDYCIGITFIHLKDEGNFLTPPPVGQKPIESEWSKTYILKGNIQNNLKSFQIHILTFQNILHLFLL